MKINGCKVGQKIYFILYGKIHQGAILWVDSREYSSGLQTAISCCIQKKNGGQIIGVMPFKSKKQLIKSL